MVSGHFRSFSRQDTHVTSESLVLQDSVPIEGPLEDDLGKLDTLLEESVPAYVLAKLDEPGWLAIFYVPDTAKVRDKVSIPIILF